MRYLDPDTDLPEGVCFDAEGNPYLPEDEPVFVPGEEDENIACAGPEPAVTSEDARLEAALRRGPVRVSDFWDSEFVVVEPEVGAVEGGKPLLYAGKSHSIAGEPGRGKSTLAIYLHLLEAREGRASLLIDYEKELGDFLSKLRSMGCTKDEASLIYYQRVKGDLRGRRSEDGPTRVKVLADFVGGAGVVLVSLDSLGRSLAAANLDENLSNDVRRWYDAVAQPLMEAGATVLLIDHVVKPPMQAKGFAKARTWAKGSGAKLEVITGAAFGADTKKPFSREQAGWMSVDCVKDNNGGHTEGRTVAELHVTPEGEGLMNVELRFPKPSVDGDGKFWPTSLMTKAARLFESTTEWVSTAKVTAAIGGGKAKNAGEKSAAQHALDRLAEEGFLDCQAGARGAIEWRATGKEFPASFEDWNNGPPLVPNPF